MNILFLGRPSEGNLEHSLLRAFRRLGYRPDTVLWPPALSTPPPLALRFPHISGSVVQATRRLREEVGGRDHYDLAVVTKGSFLGQRGVEAVRRHAVQVVCWNPDDPFDREVANHGGGIRNAIGFYDHYVTWSRSLAVRLRKLRDNVHVIPFGWDDEVFFPERRHNEATGRVAFVGTWTRSRELWVRSISDFRPIVYGNQWPKAIAGVDVRPAIYGAHLRWVLSTAAVNLNFLRPQNADSHNMRTFEIPGCGGAVVAQSSPDHKCWLEPHEARLFADTESLRAALADALARQRPGRIDAPDWLLDHRYVVRVAQLLERIT